MRAMAWWGMRCTAGSCVLEEGSQGGGQLCGLGGWREEGGGPAMPVRSLACWDVQRMRSGSSMVQQRVWEGHVGRRVHEAREKSHALVASQRRSRW